MGLEISGSRQEMKFLANGKESLAKAAMRKGRASEIAIGGGRIWGRIEFKMTTLRRFERRKFTLSLCFLTWVGRLEELPDAMLCHRKRGLRYPLSGIDMHSTWGSIPSLVSL